MKKVANRVHDPADRPEERRKPTGQDRQGKDVAEPFAVRGIEDLRRIRLSFFAPELSAEIKKQHPQQTGEEDDGKHIPPQEGEEHKGKRRDRQPLDRMTVRLGKDRSPHDQGRIDQKGHHHCPETLEDRMDERQVSVGEIGPGQDGNAYHRREGEGKGHQDAAPEPFELVAEVTHEGHTGRPRQDLSEAQGIEELLFRDPALFLDDISLHQAQDRRTAVSDGADIKRRPEHFKQAGYFHIK